MKKILILMPFLFIPFISYAANTVNGYWKITSLADTKYEYDDYGNTRIGKHQEFNWGQAWGPFFNCGIGLMKMTYNTYTHEEFFKNPEFKLFKELNIKFEKGDIYVQRITCTSEKYGESSVFYPFVTQRYKISKKGYYLFSDTIYTLEYGKK
ncbi:MAG: hypothetical protein ACPG8V_04470 [Alphaproteobacteria bacterium]